MQPLVATEVLQLNLHADQPSLSAAFYFTSQKGNFAEKGYDRSVVSVLING